jgi:hypothetical protein
VNPQAVHRDPFGSKPRSILFADEGLKMMDAKLKGAEGESRRRRRRDLTLTSLSSALSSALAPADVLPALKSIAKMKVHLHLFLASLHLMRSSFPLAASHAASALRTSRQYPGLWEVFQVRIVLIKGLLAQALDDNERAIKCFEVCIAIAGSQVEGTLAKVSILILKISAGATVRLSSSASTPASAESTYLSSLASSIIQISQQASSPPSLVFLGEFVQALTKGEITKAKQHLSNALNGANAQGANHAKALMLALLGNLFACTRNDQVRSLSLSLSVAGELMRSGDGRLRRCCWRRIISREGWEVDRILDLRIRKMLMPYWVKRVIRRSGTLGWDYGSDNVFSVSPYSIRSFMGLELIRGECREL